MAAGGGSIVATSFTAGLKGMPFLAPYVAAKHAVVGICRSLANELAGHHIRVNTVHPAGVDTPMVAGLETLEPFLSRSPELGAIFTNSCPSRRSTRATSATRCCGSPLRRHATSPASSVGASSGESCRFAGASTRSRGMPYPSTRLDRFMPSLPRSTGLRPAHWPPPGAFVMQPSTARSRSSRPTMRS
jgi:NAD(P)-dependent dehydrogenase (short-subunit alcohol dehydrogenase family)